MARPPWQRCEAPFERSAILHCGSCPAQAGMIHDDSHTRTPSAPPAAHNQAVRARSLLTRGLCIRQLPCPPPPWPAHPPPCPPRPPLSPPPPACLRRTHTNTTSATTMCNGDWETAAEQHDLRCSVWHATPRPPPATPCAMSRQACARLPAPACLSLPASLHQRHITAASPMSLALMSCDSSNFFLNSWASAEATKHVHIAA